jgi:hypothetical protein
MTKKISDNTQKDLRAYQREETDASDHYSVGYLASRDLCFTGDR